MDVLVHLHVYAQEFFEVAVLITLSKLCNVKKKIQSRCQIREKTMKRSDKLPASSVLDKVKDRLIESFLLAKST